MTMDVGRHHDELLFQLKPEWIQNKCIAVYTQHDLLHKKSSVYCMLYKLFNIRKLQSWLRYLIGATILIVLVNYNWVSNYLNLLGPSGPHLCASNLSIDCFNHFHQIPQDDPLLIQLIRTQFLFPPPKKGYNIPPLFKNFDSPSDRVDRVADILYSFGPGFFIECGALDGLIASNTFWLEKKLGWTGLLIEANQNDFSALFKIRRQAWTSNLCLSILPYPNKVNFYLPPSAREGGLPGVSGLIRREDYNTRPTKVQCVPLYTLLLAINKTTIDYFSLDVEGAELSMLQTIPFDKVIFKILNVENSYIPGGHKALATFLEEKGYIFYQFAPDNVHPYDSIFLHSSLQLAKDLIQLRRAKSGNDSQII